MLSENEIIVGRKYKHQKTGKIVEILALISFRKVQLKHTSGRITVQQDHYFMYDYALIPEKKSRMVNGGLHQYRFKDNPREKAYAIAWDKQNALNEKGTLDYLLAKDCNRPAGEVTDRDREVAATVIQWLGSPVGQSFVRDVLDTITGI